VLVFFYWKVPMPSWISRKDNEFHRHELVNLALEIPRTAAVFTRPLGSPLVFSKAGIVFHDEENAANMSYEQVQKMILDEPTRPMDPQDEEMPVKRGPNAYLTDDEAKERAAAFERAFGTVSTWAQRFDLSRVKVDTLGEDKDAAVADSEPMGNQADR
jgi:hypothetical protein